MVGVMLDPQEVCNILNIPPQTTFHLTTLDTVEKLGQGLSVIKNLNATICECEHE